MNLAEARRCLAIEDYKTIGEYLCQQQRDPDIEEYLQRYVPYEKQAEWNTVMKIPYKISGIVRDLRATTLSFARSLLTCWGNLCPLLVERVDLSDGFAVKDILYKDDAIQILIEQIHTDPTTLESFSERRYPYLSDDCFYTAIFFYAHNFRFKAPDDRLLSELLEFVT